MRKGLVKVFIAVGGFVLVMGLALFFGGRQVAEEYLARERKIGTGQLRLVDPRLQWSLDLAVDSILFNSPAVNMAIGRSAITVDLFRSLIHFSPYVQLHTDTSSFNILPTQDTLPKNLDSLPFPDISLPLDFTLRAKRIIVSDSLGVLAACNELQMESRDPQSARFSLLSLQSRYSGSLLLSARAALNWRDPKQFLSWVTVHHEKDSISAKIELEKKNLRSGKLDLQMLLRTSTPYFESMNLPKAIPRVGFFKGDLHADTRGSLKVTLAAEGRVSNLPDTGSLRLNPQQMAIKLDWGDSKGLWSWRSDGVAQKGRGSTHSPADTVLEKIKLSGKLFLTDKKFGKFSEFFRQIGGTAQGHVHGVKIVAAGKPILADLVLGESVFSRDAMHVDLLSGEGSRILLDLKPRESPRPKTARHFLDPWSGDFSAVLVNDERWIKVFTDTQVVFKSLRIQGKSNGNRITAMSEVYGLKAYGMMADSARLYHEYSPGGYRLSPSQWSWSGVTWKVTSPKSMSLRFENAEAGSVEARIPVKKFLEVQAEGLQLDKIPYRGMAALAPNEPQVSGVFVWDQKADSGHSSLNLQGRFKGEALKGKTAIQWSREFLEIRSLKSEFARSGLNASAKVRMHGRPFYSLAKVKLPDLVSMGIESDHFDLAKALAVFIPHAPLKTASLQGDFSYHDSLGFRGHLKFNEVALQKVSIPVSVKALDLYGQGDTLLIKAITASDVEPLLNDSIALSVMGVLENRQSLVLNMHSVTGLRLGLRGLMQNYRDFEGSLSMDGKIILPNKNGEILNLVVRARGFIPFSQGMKGLRIDADTVRGEYAVAGVDTQSFYTSVQTQDFRITLPDLRVKGKGGELRGRVDYAIPTRRMSATLNGQSLTAQIGAGSKIQIRDFRIDAQSDSTAFNIQAAIGSGSFEHVKAPMRASGDLSRIVLAYRKPLAQIPFLKLSATLDSSALRYRLRTLDALQGLFKKAPARKQAAHRTKPMQVQIHLETAGTGNMIETDILRMAYVGNLSMVGVYPYTLLQGRLTAREGTLGTRKQAYRIRQFEVKWLNTPIEEGRLDMDSEKKLARSCEANESDSCSVIMRLDGALNNMQFSYDSDCQGSYGAGVQVSALVYSVRRGCYSTAFSSSGGGLTYQEQALTLLETPLSGYLSEAAEKLSGKWIASAQVTGLGALAQSKQKEKRDTGSTTASEGLKRDAIALEILSKEFWRLRLRARSAYKPDIAENVNPWAYLVGLEWRPPLFRFIENPTWKRRIKNNVSMAVSLFTDPDRSQSAGQGDLLKRLGLNYNYDFWGSGWFKSVKEEPLNAKSPLQKKVGEPLP